MRTPAPSTSVPPCIPTGFAGPGPATNPLHPRQYPNSMAELDVSRVIPILLQCIEMCVAMVALHTTSTEAFEAQFAQRKKPRRGEEANNSGSPQVAITRLRYEEEEPEHPHVKQILDLVAWHIGVLDARWYVKPRSTCWFEEYLFNIYTPDMFYDILRMRRRTFDRLVMTFGHSFKANTPIGGNLLEWRRRWWSLCSNSCMVLHTIGCGQSRTGKVHCGRDFAASVLSHMHPLWTPNCMASWTEVGADRSRISSPSNGCLTALEPLTAPISTLPAPSNTIVAADHRNRNKSFSILLQGVVDSKCYFTSINTGPQDPYMTVLTSRARSCTGRWRRG